MQRISSWCCLILAVATATAAEDWAWNKPHATVLPTGDLEWAPQDFIYETGTKVRYIDYAAGDDANDGSTRDSAWRHHPGDPAATGRAAADAGADTYVFKRGVIYRGRIVLDRSGTAEQPIRLTSDPEWGSGQAVIAGSEAVTGWQQGAQHPDLPDADRVWYADLDYAPRSVWMVADDGSVTRIAIARTPNWTITDPEDVMSEWWTWQQPEWWKDQNKTEVDGKAAHLGIDTEHITREADYYQDAVIWTEWGIVMGTPFPTAVERVDTERGALAFHGIWWRDTGKIITGNRYYLEDKPHYLDASGEHWFDKQGAGGRLYIRLPDDRDPGSVRIEAARRYSLIEDVASEAAPPRLDEIGEEGRAGLDTSGVRHVTISGLAFRFTNQWWDLPYPTWMHKQVDPAAIRLRGTSDGIRISNCDFAHVTQAIQIEPINDRTHNGALHISDNHIRETDDAAIQVGKGNGSLQHADVLRNRLHRIGLRPSRQSSGHALTVSFPTTMHVAR
ncbi:MAG: hypothetical protein ACOCXJ_09065, partial [Planctomycetota bacterium]